MNNIIHLTQVAGKTAANVVTPDGVLTSVWLGDVFKMQFDKIIAEGAGWGPDDVYKTVTLCKTWPMGWEKHSHENYFTSKEELDAYVENYRDWALCEDNEVSIDVYEWDLGPTYVEQHLFY